jgi:hypothetical protein
MHRPETAPISTTEDSADAIPAWRRWTQEHGDFGLLLALFVFFRLASVWFFRPGGYVRDYADLIIYQARASWQDYGFLPYRDYWSEYPPLFPWLSLWIDRLARQFPVWEDRRLWFGAWFGLAMVLAETVTFVCVYALARKLYGRQGLRVAWLYAALFLPVYLLGGWFDALPVATIFLALALLLFVPGAWGFVLTGTVAGIGGLLKLVPLAVLAVTPLATRQWRHVAAAVGVALLVVVAIYGITYVNGPVMTEASLRTLATRTGWSTVYALVDGYNRLGKVVGDPFDPAADVGQYDPSFPQGAVWLFWGVLGLVFLVVARRRQPPPQDPWRVVAFAALTYAILLLAYPAWNPQYALYLLPFLVLVWPGWRGVTYALLFMAVTLVEHPVYFNLVAPGYPKTVAQIVAADYRQLLTPIVAVRTVVLLAIAADLAWVLLQPRARRWVLVLAAGVAVAGLIVLAPQFYHAYAEGRLASSPLRPLAIWLNAQEETPTVVTANQDLERQLGPFLDDPARLVLAGGRPGRLDPLPALAESEAPFAFVASPQDAPEFAAFLDDRNLCPGQIALGENTVRLCNGLQPPPLASFAGGLELLAGRLPAKTDDPLYVTLLWRATEAVPGDYTVFVHVVDAAGRLVGQWDQPPGGTQTSTWAPGNVVVDDYKVSIDRAAATFPLRIVAGLYDPATGARLPVARTELPVQDHGVTLQSLGG